MLFGKKGFVDGVYIVHVLGYKRMRYFYYSAREAEKEYREKNNLKYKKIQWVKAYY